MLNSMQKICAVVRSETFLVDSFAASGCKKSHGCNMAAIWLHFFYCFLLIFTTHEFHNSLKNKRQTEFYFYLALCFADWTGLEPATPCVTGMYSNQLNYRTGS